MSDGLSCSNDSAVHIKDVEKGLQKVFELATTMSAETSPEERAKYAKTVQQTVAEISRNIENALMTVKMREFFRTEIQPGGPNNDWAFIRSKTKIRKRSAFSSDEDYRTYIHCKLSDDVNGMHALHKKMGWSDQGTW